MMSVKTIADGVWPTMITPYRDDGAVDNGALERLVEWYLERGVAGLFAVCQSSEMFQLSLRERLELARECVRLSAGRVPVIASGHVADAIEDQVEEAKMMADTGVEAVVLISNRFARRDEGEDAFKRRLERFLAGMPEGLVLGFYECPAPYKRVMTPELMRFCVGTGRFGFLKDTCCSMALIREKLAIVAGTSFKLFNANSATLLESLRSGASGYSGIMANFHPDLYSWMCANWRAQPGRAEELQAFLGFASMIEYQLYPVNAMHALSLEGLPFNLISRRADATGYGETMRLEIEQMMAVSRAYSARYAIEGR
jgi:4-hydroxy-tetrahydrodipicolinate synthase